MTDPVLSVPAPGETPAVLVPVDLVPVDDARIVTGALLEVGVAGELVAHVLGELPALAVLEDRERLLAAAWLASLRSARTRRSYAADLLGWRTWLAERGLDVLKSNPERSPGRCSAGRAPAYASRSASLGTAAPSRGTSRRGGLMARQTALAGCCRS